MSSFFETEQIQIIYYKKTRRKIYILCVFNAFYSAFLLDCLFYFLILLSYLPSPLSFALSCSPFEFSFIKLPCILLHSKFYSSDFSSFLSRYLLIPSFNYILNISDFFFPLFDFSFCQLSVLLYFNLYFSFRFFFLYFLLPLLFYFFSSFFNSFLFCNISTYIITFFRSYFSLFIY